MKEEEVIKIEEEEDMEATEEASKVEVAMMAPEEILEKDPKAVSTAVKRDI